MRTPDEEKEKRKQEMFKQWQNLPKLMWHQTTDPGHSEHQAR